MISLLLAALALQAAASPPPEPQSFVRLPTPVRIEPLPAARAFDAFKAICMDTFPDGAAFDRAAAASDLGFTRGGSPERGEQEWSSTHGQIIFRTAAARRPDRDGGRRGPLGTVIPIRRWTIRCDFWVAVEEPLPTPALVAAIGQQLLGGRVQPVDELVGTSWDLGPADAGFALRLMLLPDSDDNSLFTLSLQRLPDNRPR